jgi:hypothetical protein
MPASGGAAGNTISEQPVSSKMPEIRRSSRIRKPSLKQLKNGKLTLIQPHLIDSILKDLHFQSNNRPSDTPALLTKILQPDSNGKHFDQSWEYRSIIGKLNFLEKSTRPDIA